MTEEDIEDFNEDLEKMDRCWGYSMEIVGVLLRTMSEAVSAEILANLVMLYGKSLAVITKDQDENADQV